MMPDKSAVIWTRATGEPRKIGLLVLQDDHVRFTYEREAGDLPGLSFVHDVPKVIQAGQTLTWRSTQLNPLPPMLQALAPPRTPTNLQRRLLLRYLERRGMPPENEVEWHLLLLAGRNGIGHLEVFEEDAIAQQFYKARAEAPAVDLAHSPLVDLAYRAVQASADIELDEIIQLLGPTPSPGGVMPKLLLPLAIDGHVRPSLVKIESPQFPGALVLEDIGYLIHQRLALPIPRRLLVRTSEGRHALATERFDRVEGQPIPLESFYSGLFVATAASTRPVTSMYSETANWPNFELVARFLRTPVVGATIDSAMDAKRLYQQLLLALLTGNGDTHLENFAILGRRGAARLSPVFDPTPMRGYLRHVMISSVDFGGLSLAHGDLPSVLGDAVLALAREFGISSTATRQLVAEALEVTADFEQLVMAAGIPENVAKGLVGRVQGVRTRIERAFTNTSPPPAPMPERNQSLDPSAGVDFAMNLTRSWSKWFPLMRDPCYGWLLLFYILQQQRNSLTLAELRSALKQEPTFHMQYARVERLLRDLQAGGFLHLIRRSSEHAANKHGTFDADTIIELAPKLWSSIEGFLTDIYNDVFDAPFIGRDAVRRFLEVCRVWRYSVQRNWEHFVASTSSRRPFRYRLDGCSASLVMNAIAQLTLREGQKFYSSSIVNHVVHQYGFLPMTELARRLKELTTKYNLLERKHDPQGIQYRVRAELLPAVARYNDELWNSRLVLAQELAGELPAGVRAAR